MTGQELNARLRDFEKVTVGDAREAADRIEALTEQLAAARQDADEAEVYAEELEQELNTCRIAQTVMDNTVADLEAKLAENEVRLRKAVEALRMIANIELTFLEECRDIARATLAEIKSSKAAPPYGLKGESHE